MIGSKIGQWVSSLFSNLDWVIKTMDMTQWAVVSVVFVVVGFMALRSRI